MRTIAQQIKALRNAANLTQEQLAEKCGIDQPTLSRVEAGLVPATLSLGMRISRTLGVSMDVLAGQTPKRAVTEPDFTITSPRPMNPAELVRDPELVHELRTRGAYGTCFCVIIEQHQQDNQYVMHGNVKLTKNCDRYHSQRLKRAIARGHGRG